MGVHETSLVLLMENITRHTRCIIKLEDNEIFRKSAEEEDDAKMTERQCMLSNVPPFCVHQCCRDRLSQVCIAVANKHMLIE